MKIDKISIEKMPFYIGGFNQISQNQRFWAALINDFRSINAI